MIGALAVKIDLRHIRSDRDRHGNERIYVRVPGRKQVRLRQKPGTPEFLAEYQAALAKANMVVPTAAPDSLTWLCQHYFASAEYRQLSERTRHVRRLILDKLLIEHGAKPYARLERRHVRELRDARAERPEAANSIVKALRQVFKWAIDAGHVEHNPARDVPLLRSRNPDGWHTWTVEEVEQFQARHPIGTKPRLALELLLCTGARRSDVVTFGRQMVRDGWLCWIEHKGRTSRRKERAIPILPELQGVIDATPSRHLTYLVTEFGKPYTAAGFGNWFRRQCDIAGLPHCSAHGLRKAGATIAAENGATEHQLMAIFGWTSSKMAELYTRAANRRKLAKDGIHLLSHRETVLSHRGDNTLK